MLIFEEGNLSDEGIGEQEVKLFQGLHNHKLKEMEQENEKLKKEFEEQRLALISS